MAFNPDPHTTEPAAYSCKKPAKADNKTSVADKDLWLQKKSVEQRDLLVEVMEVLRPVAPTREKFAALIGVSKRGLDKWLFPYTAGLPRKQQEFREMPELARRFLIVILEQEAAAERLKELAAEYEWHTGKMQQRHRGIDGQE